MPAMEIDQDGGFIFTALAAIGSAIAGAVSAAAAGVTAGGVGSAIAGATATYATTKALEAIGGNQEGGREQQLGDSWLGDIDMISEAFSHLGAGQKGGEIDWDAVSRDIVKRRDRAWLGLDPQGGNCKPKRTKKSRTEKAIERQARAFYNWD